MIRMDLEISQLPGLSHPLAGDDPARLQHYRQVPDGIKQLILPLGPVLPQEECGGAEPAV